MLYIKTIYPLVIYTAVSLALQPCLAEERTLTNKEGKAVFAHIIKVHENAVDIKLKNSNKVHTIQFDQLSEEDIVYLKSMHQGDGAKLDDKNKSLDLSQISKLKTEDLVAAFDLKNNFDAAWPSLISVDVSPEITIFNEDNGRYVYHSPNYEFISDVPLSKNVIKKFSVLFEATRELCRQLPLSMMKAHVPGEQFRNKILLFEHDHSYLSNGGIPGSAGTFSPRNNLILVKLESLGLKKSNSGYRYDYDKSNRTLPHEIVHQLTDHEYYQAGALGWFSEGFAEYCAVSPYRSGKFILGNNISSIKEFVTSYGKKNRGGRALGENITAPRLRDYMLMPYDEFLTSATFNYGLGLLITTYFLQMEEDRSNINAFLMALKEGKSGEEALKSLLNGRSYEELEEDISRSWKSKGVQIDFQSFD